MHLLLHAVALERGRHAALVLLHVDASRVPVGRDAVVRARVLAQILLRLALAMHEQEAVARVDRREVDAGPHLAALARAVDEVQHVTLVVDAALEKAIDEALVDALEDLERARMHGDRFRGIAGLRQAIDRAHVDAAARELERQHRAGRAGADDQDGNVALFHLPSPTAARPSIAAHSPID